MHTCMYNYLDSHAAERQMVTKEKPSDAGKGVLKAKIKWISTHTYTVLLYENSQFIINEALTKCHNLTAGALRMKTDMGQNKLFILHVLRKQRVAETKLQFGVFFKNSNNSLLSYFIGILSTIVNSLPRFLIKTCESDLYKHSTTCSFSKVNILTSQPSTQLFLPYKVSIIITGSY